MNKWRQGIIRPVVFVLLAVAAAALNHRYGWSASLTDPAALSALRRELAGHWWQALAAYTLLTVVGCVVLALPGVVFALAAGALFGPLWGTLACSFATTVGAAAAFLAGRFFLRDAVKPWVMGNRNLRRLLFEHVDRSGVYLLMVTRLVPLFPYNLQNFAYGITEIPFRTYTACSFLFMLPGTAVYTVAAAGLLSEEHRGWYLALAGILLSGVTLVSLHLRKRMKGAEQ